MSAFNLSQYNLTAFNIAKAAQIWLEGNASESFSFSFAGETFFCKGNSLTRIDANQLQVDSGRVFSGDSFITVSSEVGILGYFNLSAALEENVYEGDNNISQIVFTDGEFQEDFESNANLSQEVYTVGSSALSVDSAKMNLSQIVKTSTDLGEVFLCVAGITAYTEYVCEFPGLTLKPGDTLIIDSSLYNVLLNNQNAIHYQKGDWLDNLSRATSNLIVSGTNAANRLSVEIVYMERFL